jgi:type I restriction enzyme S subunit
LGRPAFRYIDIESVDNVALRITEPKTVTVEEAPSRARKLVRAGDVLFSTVRPYLRNIASVPTGLDGEIASTGFAVLRADAARALPGYLLAAVCDQRFVDKANALTTGASYPAITENQLFDLRIPLPPLDEQGRIVAEIEGYQKVIDGARQIRAAWEPDVETDPEWQRVPLGQIAEVQLGKMLDKAKHRAGQLLPYLRNVNVRWSSIDTEDLLEMYFEDDELERFDLREGDVLVCEGGEPGRAAVWDGRMPNLKYQKALHRVRFKVPYEPKMLVYWLRILAKSGEWAERFHGATIKHFTREMFIELEIPLPPLDVQRRIVAELDAESAQIDAVRALIPRFEAKIQRVMDRVWGTAKGGPA